MAEDIPVILSVLWMLNKHTFMTQLIKLNNIPIPLSEMLGPFKDQCLNASERNSWEVWEKSA